MPVAEGKRAGLLFYFSFLPQALFDHFTIVNRLSSRFHKCERRYF